MTHAWILTLNSPYIDVCFNRWSLEKAFQNFVVVPLLSCRGNGTNHLVSRGVNNSTLHVAPAKNYHNNITNRYDQ